MLAVSCVHNRDIEMRQTQTSTDAEVLDSRAQGCGVGDPLVPLVPLVQEAKYPSKMARSRPGH